MVSDRQKERIWVQLDAAKVERGFALRWFDKLTDKLEEAREALEEADAELEHWREVAREAGVFDDD